MGPLQDFQLRIGLTLSYFGLPHYSNIPSFRHWIAFKSTKVTNVPEGFILDEGACLEVKNIGKPCAGKPHARFDEGGLAKEAMARLLRHRWPKGAEADMPSLKPQQPALYSTLWVHNLNLPAMAWPPPEGLPAASRFLSLLYAPFSTLLAETYELINSITHGLSPSVYCIPGPTEALAKGGCLLLFQPSTIPEIVNLQNIPASPKS